MPSQPVVVLPSAGRPRDENKAARAIALGNVIGNLGENISRAMFRYQKEKETKQLRDVAMIETAAKIAGGGIADFSALPQSALGKLETLTGVELPRGPDGNISVPPSYESLLQRHRTKAIQEDPEKADIASGFVEKPPSPVEIQANKDAENRKHAHKIELEELKSRLDLQEIAVENANRIDVARLKRGDKDAPSGYLRGPNNEILTPEQAKEKFPDRELRQMTNSEVATAATVVRTVGADVARTLRNTHTELRIEIARKELGDFWRNNPHVRKVAEFAFTKAGLKDKSLQPLRDMVETDALEVLTAAGVGDFGKEAGMTVGDFIHKELSNPAALDRQSTSGKGGSPYSSMIEDAAKKYELDPDLLEAQMGQESGFDSKAKSKKGAMGLMQLMPGTAKDLGVTDPWDPAQSIDAGARHMKRLLDKYNGDERLALAAYNAGEGRVEKYGGVPPFRETRDYITRIFAKRDAKRKVRQATAATKPIETMKLADGTVIERLD